MKYRSRFFQTCLVASLIAATACILSVPLYSAPGSGADTYKAKCAMCHGPDGTGKTSMGQKFKIRDLTSADVQKQSDAELTAIITNGKPPMPAYGKTLSSAEIRDVVAYIRTLAKS